MIDVLQTINQVQTHTAPEGGFGFPPSWTGAMHGKLPLI